LEKRLKSQQMNMKELAGQWWDYETER
jgi:hypothetical protein